MASYRSLEKTFGRLQAGSLLGKFFQVEFMRGKTIVLSSHNPNHALFLDSNVILTKSGKIVDFQTTSEGEPYEYEKMLELFNVAKQGIQQIIEMY